MADYRNLFAPLVLRGHTLPSRAVLTAHTTSFGADGVPGARARAYYEARAAGGVGMIVMEPLPVLPNAGVTPQNYRYEDPAFVPALRETARAVQAHGTVFVSQLYHLGANADPYSPWPERWAPSPGQGPGWSDAVRVVDDLDIVQLIDGFVRAAQAAVAAGVDGIECMFAYDTLVDGFMDPKRNARTDGYGGAIEGRNRLAVEVLHALRATIGPDRLLGVTVSAAMQEHAESVAYLHAQCDIDYVGVGNGNYENLHLIIPPVELPAGFGVPFAANVKRHVPTLAVMAEGRIVRASIAERALAEGACDLVGMTRALIADPAILVKSRAGREPEVRECVGYNLCIARRLRKYPIACVQNPTAGHEYEGVIEPAPARRRVLVVGGGLAGLEAARVAAERGHDVTLVERTSALGGQARLLALLPMQAGFRELIEWRARELERLGVVVEYETDLDADAIAARDVDAVVVATGSVPSPLAGSVAVADVISGTAIVRGSVVVVDSEGHRKGAGVAEWLARAGCEVTFVPVNGAPVALLEGAKVGPLFLARLRDLGVALVEGHRLVGVDDGGRRVAIHLARTYDATPLVLRADHVVHATPHRPLDDLVPALRAAGIEVHAVGDARAPRSIEDAIVDGFRIASGL